MGIDRTRQREQLMDERARPHRPGPTQVRAIDLDVNPCKEKKLSNMRSAGRDENVILSPVLPMTLERAIEFIKDDEQIEVTPKSIRLRKNILSGNLR